MTPEKTMLQVVYTTFKNPDLLFRDGSATHDAIEAGKKAVELMQRYDVHEVFVCKIDAAYSKEVTIKQVL